MVNDLFDPFEDEKLDEETVESINDGDIEETPKKNIGKIIAVIVIGLVCLGLVANYIIGRSTFRHSRVGRTIIKTNHRKNGKRFLVNPKLPGGYEVVDLSIKEIQFEKKGTSKDGVQIEMLVSVNYWPNQNYLDFQHKHHMATSDEKFDIDKIAESFVFDNLAAYISSHKSIWLLENSDQMRDEIQALFDEKIRKAFVFEHFDRGRNERLVEYLELDEVEKEELLETKMFERNKWGNHAYLIESSKKYKKYFIIDDFIRIGSVKVNSVAKVEW